MPSADSWDEHRIFVTRTLERLEQISSDHEEKDEARHIELLNRISTLQSEITSLNVRAGVWGLLGGALPALVVLIVMYIEGHSK